MGNTGHLIEFAKEKYEDYLYIEGAGSIIVCNPGKREWFKASYLLESMGHFDI
ncbi:hypothetical protein [uncultured Holdemanella sp.]|uniref:hypothetical protein n=1 Tax=uncultured Holdemanella sp. TaxID=1763549 RepID=UPI00259009D0|nr:hypothetical protein [uncultured Holdemanella sp.]